MELHINTDVLSNNNLSIAEFLVLYANFYRLDLEYAKESLIEKGLVFRNQVDNRTVLMNQGTADAILGLILNQDN